MSTVQTIRVRVERFSHKPSAPRFNLYEKEIQIPNGVSVPYDALYTVLQFLYGTECIVTFELCKI